MLGGANEQEVYAAPAPRSHSAASSRKGGNFFETSNNFWSGGGGGDDVDLEGNKWAIDQSGSDGDLVVAAGGGKTGTSRFLKTRDPENRRRICPSVTDCRFSWGSLLAM